MKYCELEKGVKNSIHSSMQKNIGIFFEANDWNNENMDWDFYFNCWLSESQNGRKSSWYERLPSDPDDNFIEELRNIFNEKKDKYYHKPSYFIDRKDYLIELANKFYIEIDADKLKYYGYNQYMYIKLRKLKDESATTKQIDFARSLSKEIDNEDFEYRYYTKDEISKIIQSLLSKKAVRKKYRNR